MESDIFKDFFPTGFSLTLVSGFGYLSFHAFFMSVTTIEVADKKPLSMMFNMHASFRIQSLCKNSGNDVEGCQVAVFTR